jgi:hypothetical protein
VNRFRGFLGPRPDWIKVLDLFGTLGLHLLLTKTLKFHKISKFSKNFKILKKKKLKFKIFTKFLNFTNFTKIQNFKIFKKIQNFHKTCSHHVHLC